MRIRIVGAFALMTVIWGASFLWIKIAVLDIGVMSLVSFRLAFAVLGLLPIVAVKRPRVPRDARTWWAILVVGLTSTTIPWLCISWAEKSIDSALATVLNAMVPIFTIFMAHYALHDDRITFWRVIGLVLGFGGVALLTQSGGQASGSEREAQLSGILAMLVSGIAYSASTVVARRYLRHLSSLEIAHYSMLISAVLTWILLFVTIGSPTVPDAPAVWVAVMWLGVLGAGIASYIFYFVLHQVGPTRASLITYLIPPIGVALGVIVLDEPLDIFLIAGSVLIIAGLWVVNRK